LKVGIRNIKTILAEGNLTYVFILAAAFLLPVWRNAFVIALWPWIILFVLQIILQWKDRKPFGIPRPSAAFLPILFALMLISLIWSTNITSGLDHIGRSMMLIILPVLLRSDYGTFHDKTRFDRILKVFVAGVTVALLILWIRAIIYSVSIIDGSVGFDPVVGQWEHAFYHMAFSFLIHPTYFGMMLLFAAAICLQEVKRNNLFTKRPIWPLLLSFAFIGSLYFISSRSMIVASVFLIMYVFFSKISNKRVLLISLLTTLLVLILLLSLHPRFSFVRELLTRETTSGKVEHSWLSDDRMKTWQASIRIIKEHTLIGVGVGDVREALKSEYAELKFFTESDPYLNCHNQFLEIWVATGIAGVLIIIFLMIYPLFLKTLRNKYLYGSFLLISITAFLFESVLNRFWGIAFFSFFYLLLTFPPASSIPDKKAKPSNPSIPGK